MNATAEKGQWRLRVPLDASEVEGFQPDTAVQVLVRERSGATQSHPVKLDKGGKGFADFTFRENPGAINVVVGPEDASAEELLALQTINVQLTHRHFGGKTELEIPAIKISAYFWWWWRRWCRTFTIRGRVLCPDGSPVPGATVCAYDVDWWWWWVSRQQVGACAVTDASGSFSITFKWCCGWWPWWWWNHRQWAFEPAIAERIMPAIEPALKTGVRLQPAPQPSLAVFDALLGEPGANPRTGAIDPAILDSLRHKLVAKLPGLPEFERLKLWPWWPWRPWWDCSPDINFRVTQDCTQPNQIILNENVFDTRWDIGTTLDVTLVASDDACCIDNPGDPEGNCMVITEACDDPIENIGGNTGAPALPKGLVNPGLINAVGDRPYAGDVPISGLFGDTAAVDYYEFEWLTEAEYAGGPPAAWHPMPVLAAGNFSRQFWGPGIPAGPVGFHWVPFNFTALSGRNVVQSREFYEANNGAGTWGLTRFWTYNRDMLMDWLTDGNFADGTYYLRVRAWNLVGGNLQNDRILPVCDTREDNFLVLTLDNRLAPGLDGHPLGPPHPCGSGTVHVCTTEPDTDFVSVRINGAEVMPCDIVDARHGGTLDIDFLAHDPDGYLSSYSLVATYGNNQIVDLLSVPGATLSAGPMAGAVPPAAQVGPDYGAARLQGAPSPVWKGGTITLHIPNLHNAFPVTCAYQLELRAYKRTIVSCNDQLPFANLSEYSITVDV